ncbi:hypothetical protein RRG08_049900 [Elysia crispata]|uniref:Uncharacterized protein n=1 Tax=Elysia crispata TaxID=231223 RepID=A0AAE1CPT0_9GAST|nr:hypothetical protein RRG08_049900 [Elysia crispata]
MGSYTDKDRTPNLNRDKKSGENCKRRDAALERETGKAKQGIWLQLGKRLGSYGAMGIRNVMQRNIKRESYGALGSKI